jgi:uncharacterized membrane protein
MKKDNTTSKIIGLGIISGMRATFAPAIAAHYLSKQTNPALAKSQLGFIQSPVAAVVTKLLSLGEIVGDKLPNTPNRIAAPQVMARVASGAFAGAIISVLDKNSISKGILMGGAAALAATFTTFYLRRYISKATFIKEPVTGALEDVLAISAGIRIMR